MQQRQTKLKSTVVNTAKLSRAKPYLFLFVSEACGKRTPPMAVRLFVVPSPTNQSPAKTYHIAYQKISSSICHAPHHPTPPQDHITSRRFTSLSSPFTSRPFTPRRQAQCRALVAKMRDIYAQCQEMSHQESSLKAAAMDMEVWERRSSRGEILIGREQGGGVGAIVISSTSTSSNGENDWGEKRGGDADDEQMRRRKAGVRIMR